MNATLLWLAKLLTDLLKSSLTHLLAYYKGKSVGKQERELEQARTDLEVISRAANARSTVIDDGLHNDPYNRDNKQ